jgi:hypothetical protein
MTQNTVLVAFSLIGIGVLLALAYLALGRARLYLLYLGLAFTVSGLGTLLGGVAGILCFLLAVVLLVFAFRNGLRETRERWTRMQEEGQDRAAAFGEYLAEKARKEAEEEEAKQREQAIDD